MNITASFSRPDTAVHTNPQQSAVPKSADSKEEQTKFLNAGDETTEIFSGRDNDAFSKKLTEVFKRENHDLIQGLSELSDQDKTELALNAYFQMQGRVQQAIKREEADIKIFSAFEEEKTNLTSMLEEAHRNGTAVDPAGDPVTASAIEKKLEKVQGMIDKLVDPYSYDEKANSPEKTINESIKKDFAAYAGVFEEMTGLTGDALGTSDALLIHKTDRTESSFIQKAYETIDSLKTQSSGLRDLKKEFMGEVGIEEEEERMSEEAMTKMAVFEFFRERFAYAGLYDSSETLSMLDTNA